MVRGEATKVLGMASQIYAGLVVAGYEAQGRCCDLNFDARRPLSLDQLLVSLGVRCLAAFWGSMREVLDLLFEASVDIGEWFSGPLSINLHKARSLRGSST